MELEHERTEKRRAKWRRNFAVKYAKSPYKQQQRFKTYYEANKDDINRRRRERRAEQKAQQKRERSNGLDA